MRLLSPASLHGVFLGRVRFGRVLSEIDPTGATVRANGYDNLGRLITRWTPAFGYTYFTYGAEGDLLAASGAVTNTFTYDALHRLSSAGLTNEETFTTFTGEESGSHLNL